jgi:hypothetical protein
MRCAFACHPDPERPAQSYTAGGGSALLRPARTWLFRGLALALAAGLLELTSFLLLWARDGAIPTPSRLQARCRAAHDASAQSVIGERPPALELVHPYLGFVYDPAADSPDLRARHGVPISRFGFLDLRDPIVAPRPDRVVVGLFGGSFAASLFQDAREVLVRRLQGSPRFAGREVVVVNTALGGYKQPQQLATLAYLLALGGHFDLIVNLDGFNEVVLPVLENLPKGVFLAYPRSWYLRAGEIRSGPELGLIARVEHLRSRRLLAAGVAAAPGLRASLTVHLLWRAVDRGVTRELGRAEQALVGLEASEHRFLTSGPFEPFPDRRSMLASLAGVWRDSSLQMDRLARGNGARYLHFLQPNQYLEGSKPLTPEERAVAVDESSPYPPLAREGYPYLLTAGQELLTGGVEFHDLTRIFAGVDETLYRDTCCHVNARGSERVADAIADAILAGPGPRGR